MPQPERVGGHADAQAEDPTRAEAVLVRNHEGDQDEETSHRQPDDHRAHQRHRAPFAWTERVPDPGPAHAPDPITADLQLQLNCDWPPVDTGSNLGWCPLGWSFDASTA